MIIDRKGYIHITDLLALADNDGIDQGALMALYEEYIFNLDDRKDKLMKTWYLIALYLAAIIAANLLVTTFGPSIAVVNSFVFIGLDLTTRDYLHDAWRGRQLWLKMLLLVGGGSILSYLLNRNSGQIAVASFTAFAGAGAADTLVYWLLGDKSRLLKINGSNITSAAVDSLIFPVMAFGLPVLWWVVGGQFLAKVLGGFVWSIILALTGPTQAETGPIKSNI